MGRGNVCNQMCARGFKDESTKNTRNWRFRILSIHCDLLTCWMKQMRNIFLRMQYCARIFAMDHTKNTHTHQHRLWQTLRTATEHNAFNVIKYLRRSQEKLEILSVAELHIIAIKWCNHVLRCIALYAPGFLIGASLLTVFLFNLSEMSHRRLKFEYLWKMKKKKISYAIPLNSFSIEKSFVDGCI